MPTPRESVGLHTARRWVSWLRVALGVSVFAVLCSNYVLGLEVDGANPFNFYGYFTNLTSLLTGLVLLVAGALALGGRHVAARLHLVRGVLVACMVVVGVIYNLLVPGTGSAPAWASFFLHVAMPGYVLLDWALVGDRPVLEWRRLWLVLPYPLLWLAVVLVRGQTDGWVPYGFLLPSHGPAYLLAHIAGLLSTLLAAGLLVWGLSRARGLEALTRS